MKRTEPDFEIQLKGRPRDEDGTVLAASRHQGKSVQRGGRSDRHGLQAPVSLDDPPSRLEQVLRQPRRSVHGAGLRREGERQDRPSLQATAEIEDFNQANPSERVFVISYDDFNPYLDHYRAAIRAIDTAEVLRRWQLQDHMDAILSLGVTQLVDLLTTEKVDLSVLSLDQRRDLLLLAALYDASTGEPIERRWSRLRRRSGFRPLWSRRDLQIGFGTTLVVIVLIAAIPFLQRWSVLPWLLVPVLAGWIYWGWRLVRAEWYARDIRKGLKVLSRDPSALRWELLWFKPSELGGQPLPTPARRAEERYELLRKFQGVLATLGYGGIIVLIDRVDEPQQIEGDPRKMRALIWPLLDHKFLRHPGIGIKLLLPIELAYYLEKEDKEFYDRARPDKLNMIKPLRWTGPHFTIWPATGCVPARSFPRPMADPLLQVDLHAAPRMAACGCEASSTNQSATTRSKTPWATCVRPGTCSSFSTA